MPLLANGRKPRSAPCRERDAKACELEIGDELRRGYALLFPGGRARHVSSLRVVDKRRQQSSAVVG